MTVSRVEAFSDGVFAVAITLLVLQFTVPQAESGHLLGKLLDQWPLFATYVASFLTVGVIWVNHHTIFSGLKATDRTLQFINLVLLLLIVLVPYPTQLLARYLQTGFDGSVAAAFYGVLMTCMSITFQVLVLWAINHPQLLKPAVDPAQVRSFLPRFALGLLVYAVSIGLAFVNAWLVVALFAASAVYYAFNHLPWVPGPTD
jgi:uncharacterized membrane protein